MKNLTASIALCCLVGCGADATDSNGSGRISCSVDADCVNAGGVCAAGICSSTSAPTGCEGDACLDKPTVDDTDGACDGSTSVRLCYPEGGFCTDPADLANCVACRSDGTIIEGDVDTDLCPEETTEQEASETIRLCYPDGGFCTNPADIAGCVPCRDDGTAI